MADIILICRVSTSKFIKFSKEKHLTLYYLYITNLYLDNMFYFWHKWRKVNQCLCYIGDLIMTSIVTRVGRSHSTKQRVNYFNYIYLSGLDFIAIINNFTCEILQKRIDSYSKWRNLILVLLILLISFSFTFRKYGKKMVILFDNNVVLIIYL